MNFAHLRYKFHMVLQFPMDVCLPCWYFDLSQVSTSMQPLTLRWLPLAGPKSSIKCQAYKYFQSNRCECDHLLQTKEETRWQETHVNKSLTSATLKLYLSTFKSMESHGHSIDQKQGLELMCSLNYSL